MISMKSSNKHPNRVISSSHVILTSQGADSDLACKTQYLLFMRKRDIKTERVRVSYQPDGSCKMNLPESLGIIMNWLLPVSAMALSVSKYR